MKGLNKMDLNQDQMREIVQEWIDRHTILFGTAKVVSFQAFGKNRDRFVVDIEGDVPKKDQPKGTP